MTISRSHLVLAATGLVAGLALGVTGFAHAANPSPSPGPGQGAKLRMHDGFGMPGGGMRGHHRAGYGGLVTSLGSSSLSLRTPKGTETVGLTSSTAFYDGMTKATRSALKVGEVVHVRLVDPQATAKVAAVVTVVPAHLIGWVSAVGDSTLTLTDMDGFTRTVRTSSATTYEKDGAAATRGAMTVGTLVRALGTVDADGSSLDATKVATGLPAPGDHPMGDPEDGPQA